jgi:hypothetical protein
MSDLVTIITAGDKRSSTREYKAGTKTVRYNRTRNCPETIVVNEDCVIDVTETWNYADSKWELNEEHWETARKVERAPVVPRPPKPPGFFARLWARLRGTNLPKARLLNG